MWRWGGATPHGASIDDGSSISIDVGPDGPTRPRRRDGDIDVIVAINAGGYVDPPLHNDVVDIDAGNAGDANTMV